MTSLPVPSTAAAIEGEAVDTIAHWIDLTAVLLTSEASRLVMRDQIRGRLRQGTIPTMQVIEAAEAGHQDADLALREAAIEMIGRHEEMPTELAAYVQRALRRPPTTYPQGRNLADTWLRDIDIAFLVKLAIAGHPEPRVKPSVRQHRRCARPEPPWSPHDRMAGGADL